MIECSGSAIVSRPRLSRTPPFLPPVYYCDGSGVATVVLTKVVIMTAMSLTIERHHRLIIAALALVILFFLAASLFHDVIPICHFLFGCDHSMH